MNLLNATNRVHYRVQKGPDENCHRDRQTRTYTPILAYIAVRTTCKIPDMKNTSIPIGDCLVVPESCDVYWCCDETKRYGELLKYK